MRAKRMGRQTRNPVSDTASASVYDMETLQRSPGETDVLWDWEYVHKRAIKRQRVL